MDHSAEFARPAAQYELRFISLYDEGRGFTFPCNAAGHVDATALKEPGRRSLAHAMAAVGREFATPIVMPSDRAWAH